MDSDCREQQGCVCLNNFVTAKECVEVAKQWGTSVKVVAPSGIFFYPGHIYFKEDLAVLLIWTIQNHIY